MNIFGDLGELHKLFEDTKSTTKSSTTTDELNIKDKISDPKWLKRSIQSSTDNLDKYILSNIASNKDLNKIANLKNNKIIEIIDKNDNKEKKNSAKKNSAKKNSVKKNSAKKDEKNSEELVNLYKKMNDVFSSMQINKKK